MDNTEKILRCNEMHRDFLYASLQGQTSTGAFTRCDLNIRDNKRISTVILNRKKVVELADWLKSMASHMIDK